MASHSKQGTFTIPVGAGTYSTELMYFRVGSDTLTASTPLDTVHQVAVCQNNGSLATVALDFEFLRPGTDHTVDGNWNPFSVVLTNPAGGTLYTYNFAGWFGVRCRGRSTGTAGSLVVNFTWTYGE